MLVKDIINVCWDNQVAEIANPTEYYFGKLSNIPDWLKDYEVKYMYAGLADTQGPNGENYHDVLCMDAEPLKNTKARLKNE